LPRDLANIKAWIIAAVKNIDALMLTRVWQELECRIDVCRVTCGAHIEHPRCTRNFFSFPVAVNDSINLLTPNDDYSGRTAPLTSKCCILYIYSTNIGTEYFKHGIYSLFFPLQNAVCFINLTYLVPVLFTFYLQGVLKLKEIIPAPKG